MRRKNKTGSVTKVGEGRYWARAPRQRGGQRPSLGIWPTEEEAIARLERGYDPSSKSIFIDFAHTALDARELEGVRSIRQERTIFAAHLAEAHFARMPIGEIKPPDIARWLREMNLKKVRRAYGKRLVVTLEHPVSRGTISRALALAKAIFRYGGPQDAGLIERNPCDGMKVKRRIGVEATRDAEVFLTLEEQRAIRHCAKIPDHERFYVLFAIGCGLRRSEQFNLELRDVHADVEDPYVVVRFGSDGKPTKSGKGPEPIGLFGYALEAARWQLEQLKAQPNPHGLLWPTLNGYRRRSKALGSGHFRPSEHGTHVYPREGKCPVRVKAGTGTHVFIDRFREVLELAGITRHVRWHDLRHTCASSLYGGDWGEAWTLREVQGQLRHSSIAATERYAHRGNTMLKHAARKVRAVI